MSRDRPNTKVDARSTRGYDKIMTARSKPQAQEQSAVRAKPEMTWHRCPGCGTAFNEAQGHSCGECDDFPPAATPAGAKRVLTEASQEAAAGPAADPPPTDICWLIERGQSENHSPTIWWRGQDDPTDKYCGLWTENAINAQRFDTAKAAQIEAQRKVVHLFRVTEHVFLDTDPPPQEHSAATVHSGNRVAEETASDAKDGSIPSGGAHPPPPEDALLAEIGRWIGVLSVAKVEDFLNDNDCWHIKKALSDARDRIAAEAHQLAIWQQSYKDCADSRDSLCDELEAKLAAAEARAQGLEADARRYRWLRDIGDDTWQALVRRPGFWRGWARPNDVDTAIDAALARPVMDLAMYIVAFLCGTVFGIGIMLMLSSHVLRKD